MNRDAERKLKYAFSEGTRFSLRMEFYAGQADTDPSSVSWVHDLLTLRDAQMKYVGARDLFGLDAQRFLPGDVFDENKEHIARISFAGHLWRPEPLSEHSEVISETPKWGAARNNRSQADSLNGAKKSVLREMIFDIVDRTNLVPSYPPMRLLGARVPGDANDWAYIYGAMMSYESAIDAAGFATEAQMKNPKSLRTVVMVNIDENGTVQANWHKKEFTFTPRDIFDHFGMAPFYDLVPESDALDTDDAPENYETDDLVM